LLLKGLCLFIGPLPGDPLILFRIAQIVELFPFFYRALRLTRTALAVLGMKRNGNSILFFCDLCWCMALWAGNNPPLFRYRKVGNRKVPFLGSAHEGCDQFQPVLLLCLLAVLITSIEGIGNDLLRGYITLLYGFNGRDEGMGIAFMGRLHMDIGDEVKPLFLLIRAIGLHELHLIPLVPMSAIGCIGIRGVLEGIGRDLLGRLYRYRGIIGSADIALFFQYAHKLFVAFHRADLVAPLELLYQPIKILAYLIEVLSGLRGLYP